MREGSFNKGFPLFFFCPRNASIMIVLIMCEKLVCVLAFCVRRLGTRSVLGICLVVTEGSPICGEGP